MPTTSYWLQSVLFLAGVTLSAAVIQGRFSRGTIASKLDRLWQAGITADAIDLPALRTLRLKETVVALARDIEQPESVLLALKECYAKAIETLAQSVPVEAEIISEQPLDSELSARFGFRDELAEAIGPGLRCMIVYGSSVTSTSFADYDVIVVSEKRNTTLHKLRHLAPHYRGVELNVSVFEPDEFWHYQVLSGDNLSHHGVCIRGEAVVPRKTEADLFARNFSFGFIRLRQIIGMSTPIEVKPEEPDNSRRTLHEYFAKIPLNVARGILGAKSVSVTKEELLSWSLGSLGYSPTASLQPDNLPSAMAAAAWATHHTMIHFNDRYCVCAHIE